MLEFQQENNITQEILDEWSNQHERITYWWKLFLCVTNEILLEYHEILTKRYNYLIANTVLKELMETPNVERINPTFRFNLITADPDDNKIVDCAIIAGATYIVSNDKHFQELERYDFPKVDVRSLAEFLQIVRSI